MTKANDPKMPRSKMPGTATRGASKPAGKMTDGKMTKGKMTGGKTSGGKPLGAEAPEGKSVGARTPGAKSHGDSEIAEALLELVAARGADKTVCPSEVARHLAGTHPDAWSPLMQPIRRVAVRLTKEGRIALLRKGKPVDDPDDFRGIYRLGFPVTEA